MMQDFSKPALLAVSVAGLIVLALFLLPTPREHAQPAQATVQPGDFVITGAVVFDGERFWPQADVWVSQGRIKAMAEKLNWPDELPSVPGQGSTLLPGLIDAHTHVFGDALASALRFGVTTELDMFSDFHPFQRGKNQRAALSARTRADWFSAGTLVTAPGGHGTEYGFAIPTLDTPGEAGAFVDARLTEGSDYIKLVLEDGSTWGAHWPTLDAATLQAAIRAAHARGVLAVVHVSSLDSAKLALRAGADGLMHLFDDRPVDAEFLHLAKAGKAFVVPTLSVLESVAGVLDAQELLDDPRLGPYLSTTQRASLKRGFGRPVNTEAFALALGNVQALYRSGIPILAGTDSGNPGTAHGASLHHEMQLLSRAGLPVQAVLAAASGQVARFFPIATRGRIAAGSRADLLLVHGDLRSGLAGGLVIEGIWKNGFKVQREAIRGADSDTVPRIDPGKLISDFEQDLGIRFGVPWQATTDSRMGGQSKAQQQRITPGAHGSLGALRVSGRVNRGYLFPWAGSVFFPASIPMQAVDASDRSRLEFTTRGDGSRYAVLFLSGDGGIPARFAFVAGPHWRQVRVDLAAVPGLDLAHLQGIAFSAGPDVGPFRFDLDDIVLQ